MDAPRINRIDRIDRALNLGIRRRHVVTGLMGAALAVPAAAVAHDATPTAEAGPAWLFVQHFAAATLTPNPAAPETYALALSGLDPAMLAFTDHPDRLVATIPTAAFAEMIAARAADPLNATLVASSDAGAGEVSAVVVLAGAEHDAAAGSVTYRVVLLAEAEGPLLAEPIAAASRQQMFGAGHLFVDGETLGDMAQQVTTNMQSGEKAIVAPAYAAGAISAARSVHRTKRQHEKPTRR